jgi:hypothetical protein
MWRPDCLNLDPIYQVLRSNFPKVMDTIARFDFWCDLMVKNATLLQKKYPDQIVDYCLKCKEGLPASAKIVCFPRNPKPHELTAPWVKEHWVE